MHTDEASGSGEQDSGLRSHCFYDEFLIVDFVMS